MDWSIDDVLRSISEDLDDIDTFSDDDQIYWNHTFQSLMDDGGLEYVEQVVRQLMPSDHILEVGPDYILMNVSPPTAPRTPHSQFGFRKLRIEYSPTQTLAQWLRNSFIPKLKAIEQEYEPNKERLTRERHPLFFEDLSPWGNEMGKPWGWQVTLEPIAEPDVFSGEGLDDVDEFVDDEDKWRVTLSNKHHPGKAVVGIVGWKDYPQDSPSTQIIERNDFKLAEEVAKRILWAVYWAAGEMHGENAPIIDPVDIEISDLFQLNRAEIELMKYLNDPEHYGKEYPSKPGGWDRVGTGVHESAERPAVMVNGKPFLKLTHATLANLQMNGWFWYPANAPAVAHQSADEIFEAYQSLFIYYGPEADIASYMETPPAAPVSASGGLDDVDEFDDSDPDADREKWESAERQAARDVRTQMLKEFVTINNPGIELLMVGCIPGRPHPDTHAGIGLDTSLRPYAIVGMHRPNEDDYV